MMEKILYNKEIFAQYKKPGEEFGMFPLGARLVTKDDYRSIMGKAAD